VVWILRREKCLLSLPSTEMQFQPWTGHDTELFFQLQTKNLYELKSVFAKDMTLSQRETLTNIRLTINKKNLRKYLTIIICPRFSACGIM
jgi:hypothetical protein